MISPALSSLYAEHETILAMAERVDALATGDVVEGLAPEITTLIDFFRRYGDGFHHAKEEEILFPRLIRANESLAPLVESLSDHHELFRERLRSAEQAVAGGDLLRARADLLAYVGELRDHISAEDDELFVTADDVLDEREKEEIYYSFIDRDRDLGIESKQELERHAARN